MQSKCVTADRMSAFLRGEAPAADEQAISEHLEHCPNCEQLAARLSDDEHTSQYAAASPSPLAQDVLDSSVTDLRRRLHMLAVFDHQDARVPVPDATVIEGFSGRDTSPELPPLSQEALASALADSQANDSSESSADEGHWSDEQPLKRLGRFDIVRQIGAGGFGVVYLAEDRKLRRSVAIKVARNSVLSDPGLHDRFFREAEALARLSHPHITPVYEADETDGVCFLVMAYCDGPTLEEWMTAREGLPVEPELAAKLLVPLAEAVEHAHAQGILHRDIKPGNVLLDKRRGDLPFHPMLTDFGLAKVVEDRSNSTLSGVVLGTAQYMAPEQAAGHVERIGPATDVYALGAILYQLLTGKPPIEGSSMIDTLRRLLIDEPVEAARLVTGLPDDISAIAMKCLEKSPSERYRAAADLSTDLQRFLAGKPTKARPWTLSQRTMRFVRRKPAWAAISALSVCVLVSVAAVFFYSYLLSRSNTLAYRAKKRSEDLESAVESRDRDLAAQKLLAEESTHVGQLSDAAEAAAIGDVVGAWKILQARIPKPGEPELRGFGWHYLWAMVARQPLLEKDVGGTIYQIRLSPSKRELAAVLKTGELQLYRTSDLTLLDYVETGHGEVNGVAFSPDGRWIATAGDDGNVCVWNQADLSLQQRFAAHEDLAFSALFSPDGRQLVTCGNDSIIKIFDLDDPSEPVATLTGHSKDVEALAFSPDGSQLASASSDRTTILWSWPEREQLHVLHGHESRVACVAFAPDGLRLATGAFDNQAILWDARTGALLARHEHVDNLQSIVFSPDGQRLITSDRNGAILDFAVRPAKGSRSKWQLAVQQADDAWVGHEGRVWSLIATDEAGIFFSAGHDGLMKRWGPRSDAERVRRVLEAKSDDAYMDLAYTPSGQQMFVLREKSGVEVRNPLTLEVICQLEPVIGSQWATLEVLSGRDEVAAGDCEGRVAIWNWRTGKLRLIIKSPDEPFSVSTLAWSPNAELLAVVPYGVPDVRLYEPNDGRLVKRLPTANHRTAAFSPDGKWLAADSEKEILLFDVQSGMPAQRFVGHDSTIYALAFSPDGQHIVSAGGDRAVHVWSLDGKLLRTTQHHAAAIDIVFAGSGDDILSGDEEGHLRLSCTTLRHTALELPADLDGLRRLYAVPGRHQVAAIDNERNIILLGSSQP